MAEQDLHSSRILIIDFGSQYTRLIARRIRELNVYCEIHGYQLSETFLSTFAPAGIVLSGGPETVTNQNAPQIPPFVFQMGVPVLGICYGMQAMARQLGGQVALSEHREFGYAEVSIDNHNDLFANLHDLYTDQDQPALSVWMSHGDKVTQLPEGFTNIGRTTSAPVSAMADFKRRFYGLQFHPEVTHTPQGMQILDNFVHQICAAPKLWNPGNIVEDALTSIGAKVGNEQVLLGLSGGVDSAVLALLLHRAIGPQLTCVFVDTGLLRLREAEQLMEIFADKLGVKVIKADAREPFMAALKGVSDPEQKRKIIGTKFIEIFDQEATKLGEITWLAQGTIYPDVIESAGSTTGGAHLIKSHHNVGGLPDKMKLKLLEPLRELFKDEVRKVGAELGLDPVMLYRHPFPGPGLGVRILGEITPEYADRLRLADAIFMEELHNFDYYHKVSQAFAVYLPVKSVGVMGDGRRYEHVIALRAVETSDFMTAHWAHLPYELLGKTADRIVNEVDGISRVVYDISGKPPATIEWE